MWNIQYCIITTEEIVYKTNVFSCLRDFITWIHGKMENCWNPNVGYINFEYFQRGEWGLHALQMLTVLVSTIFRYRRFTLTVLLWVAIGCWQLCNQFLFFCTIGNIFSCRNIFSISYLLLTTLNFANSIRFCFLQINFDVTST